MPLQLRLDSTVPQLVKPFLSSDIDLLVDTYKGYYEEEGERVGEVETQEEAYERIVFALISVNSAFDATCKAWEKVREVRNGDKWSIYHGLRARGSDGSVVQYAATKASWIGRLWMDAFENGVSLLPVGMDDNEYRLYLQHNIKGLALAKGSFAAMLCKGKANICCIDTHMHRLFTGNVAKKGIGKRVYLAMEEGVREIAGRHGIATSVAQHCIWDGMRGERSRLLP